VSDSQVPPTRDGPVREVTRKRVPAWAVVAVAALIGLNLRATMGSVPPLLDAIAADLDLSRTTEGLLTSMVILFVGLSAPFGQNLAARVGSERATAVLLGVLSAGALLRLGATHLATFLISSAVCGIGMGGASALMPSLIAHHVPRIRGLATGIYCTGLAVGIGLAAGIAVPTAKLLGGWRPALALWGVATALTAFLWLLIVPRLREQSAGDSIAGLVADHRLPWRSVTAWWVTWFTCACMIIGFSGLAWVIPAYVELGVPTSKAATYLIIFQLIQLVAMLVLPSVSDFTKDRRPLLLLTLCSAAAGIAGIVFAPNSLAVPTVCLFGIGAGGCFTLSLVLLTDVTDSQADGARLNAMVMVVAYPVGALAPLLLGFLHDVTGSFDPGYLVVLGVTLIGVATIPAFRPGRSISTVTSGGMATAPDPGPGLAGLDSVG